MKKTFLILLLFIYNINNAQIVNIPDANFKNALLSASTTSQIAKDVNYQRMVIDTNNDGEIQVSEAENVYYLRISYRNLSNLTGIEEFVNLITLQCDNNLLTSLDVSNNTNLVELHCHDNQLVNLDVSTSTALSRLLCKNNQLTNLDVSNNANLTYLWCYENQLTSLNVSNIGLTYLDCHNNQLTNLNISNTTLTKVDCADNSNLTYINIKNGNNNEIRFNNSNFENLPNLQTVCVDELNTSLVAFIILETGHSVTFTEYCSFEPAQSNQIKGLVKVDVNNNGCDNLDLNISNALIFSTNGVESFATYTQENGDYVLYTNEGNFTTTAATNLPSYWSVTPTSQTNTFTGFDNTFTADFCITPNQTINDVNISISPLIQARPGFNTTYRIVYTNTGTTTLNGDINFTFDNTKLSFLNASETLNTQTSNSLTFNYTNLNPFETRTIDLDFNVNAPTATPPTNIGDVLNFIATINPISGDFTTEDNIFTLNQTVVGSYDPNDITCLEGDEILLEDTDKYLHYVIRFQNSGTASAINIVVKNILDAKLDWSTFQLETTSHDSRVAIKNSNKIEFIFENINLPHEDADEPGSHGFIAYKIKPKNNVVVGDVIPNKADIFFDYNAAIVTNTATTNIVNTLAINENTLLDFSVYPIPTRDILKINSKTIINSIKIYSKLGQLILSNYEKNSIDVSNLSHGIYFVNVEDVNGDFGVKKVFIE